ncbi:MAG: hypothetical protein LBG58_12120 [Planctomycetaceae bacterium]|jgi:hypothetical protein|nr:hypothetical protein [Planctomycetaceae bacterium]
MSQILIDAAERINAAIANGKEVYASWDDFTVQIFSAKYEKRDDGEHLLGYDIVQKEYCIGGAIVQYENKNTILWFKGEPMEEK